MGKGMIQRWLVPVVMILSVLLLGWYLLCLQGQGRESDAEIAAVTSAVTDTLDVTAMQPADTQMVKRLYGLDPADYAGVTLYYPVTNMDAEELLIVKLQELTQQETVEKAIHSRLETQKASFDGYGVEQFDLLKKSVLTVEGNYILFVVNKDAEQAQQAFLKAL